MSWKITLEVTPSEAHSELQNQIELADLSFEDAQAARNAMNAALAFLNDVGDPSRDPGVTITLEGETGVSLSVTVEAIAAPAPVPQPNVPVDVEEVVVAEGYVIAGETANPETGDPLVDNVPGHEDAPDPEPSVPEPGVVQPALDETSDGPSDALDQPETALEPAAAPESATGAPKPGGEAW